MRGRTAAAVASCVALFIAVGWAVLGPGLFVQSTLSALTMGSQYALIAIGYTMVYGVIRLINFAHGDIFMLGSFIAYYGMLFLALPWWGAMAISMVATGFIGVLAERVAYRPLRQAPKGSLLISAIALSLFFENAASVAFGPQSQAFIVEGGLVAPRQATFFGQPTYFQDLLWVVPLITLGFLVLLSLFINRTKVGTAVRAASQDLEMARMLGISVDGVVALTFFIGAALAAAGGVMYSMQYVQIHPLMGILPGIKAFTAAVLGGIGSIPGAALGGLLLGVVETFVVAYFPGLTSFQQVFSVLVLLLLLLVRPTGLLGGDMAEKV